jgi:hypothetical protein
MSAADGFCRGVAPVFGRWSLLMHADDDQRRLTREALIELREAENAIDQLHAALQEDERPAHEIRQLNIDGPLIEWWEGWGRGGGQRMESRG